MAHNPNLSLLLDESNNKNNFVTSLKGLSDKNLSFWDAAIEAAREAAVQAGEKKISLLIENSYESHLMCLAFNKAGIDYTPFYLKFKHPHQDKFDKIVDQISEKISKKIVSLEVDFTSDKFIGVLETLQSFYKLDRLETALKIWAFNKMESFTIIAGRFVLPQISGVDSFDWSLPSVFEYRLFQFFQKQHGVASFFTFTNDLCFAQMKSNFSKKILSLYKEKNSCIETFSHINELFYKDILENAADQVSLIPLFFDVENQAAMEAPKPYFNRLMDLVARGRNHSFNNLDGIKQFVDLNFFNLENEGHRFSDSIFEKARNIHYKGAIFDTTRSKNSDSRVHALFPLLMTSHYYEKDVQPAKDYLLKQEFFINSTLGITSFNLHEREELQDVVKFFHRSIEFHLDQLGCRYDSYTLNQCWANKTKAGFQHHKHHHPNSMLSGVFYLNSGPCGETEFSNYQIREIIPQELKYTRWNSTKAEVSPEKGKLVLFPSNLFHETKPHKNPNDDRISIAFNVTLRGNVGDYIGASWWKT